jgi:maltose alpha-D-glucosyltransferase/alpha-amylase
MSLEVDSIGTVQALVRGTAEAPAPAADAVVRPVAVAEDPLWYKDAVIYQVHVKSYFDSTNDGVGDFSGLIAKLDYIASLGVTAIWLLPFYPSPRRDDGYDIADYRGVHPDYGTMADARRFIAEAHRRGLRVITELIVNHTSDQHPWFQRARTAKPGSSWRNFYVWSDNDQAYAGTRIIFCDTEKSNWTWDPVAKAYFWHRFYSHQPDLNFDNPQVVRAVMSVMRFWLDMGVDGLRLDAVPYLIEREGTSNENLPETHAILKAMRAEVDRDYDGRMLLAEANMWPEDVQQYFGGTPGAAGVGSSGAAGVGSTDVVGDECHMAFHFPLMPRMYMAIAQEDRFPMTDILRQTPDIPANCQWAVFLRNHDELTLEMVTDKERDYLWNFYASERRARINLGIRRRLAPLLERDRRRIELMNSLLLSMPGTPVIYYGDEIGMGDNIHLGDRDGVRTPMQWSPDRNGGFSRADPARLVLPPIMDALYGYQAVNVEAQDSDPHSLLNWMRRMLAIRAQHKAFGRGTLRLLWPRNRKIFAYLREYTAAEGTSETILCVANVSRAAQAVELDLSGFAGRVPVEMIGGSAFPPIGQMTYLLTLPPYGFYWFVLATQASMPAWHVEPPQPMPEYSTLVLRTGVDDLFRPPVRTTLEGESFPLYLGARRWYQGKSETVERVRMAAATVIPATPVPYVLTEIEVQLRGSGTVQRYALPLGFVSEDDTTSALPHQLAMARLRRGRRVGLLTDAFALPGFVYRMLDLLREGATLPVSKLLGEGELRFLPTSRMASVDYRADPEVRYLSAEQSNSSVVAGNAVIFKLIRRVQPGVHPEAEMTRYLTEVGFANIAPMLGEVTRVTPDGTPHVVAVVQGFLHNQGDAWEWTLATLERLVLELAMTPATGSTVAEAAEAVEQFAGSARQLGRRLGEMHMALGRPSDDPAFAPRHADDADVQRWRDGALAQLAQAFALLHGLASQGSGDPSREAERGLARELLARREALEQVVGELAEHGAGSLVTRIHGDLHLGQVLVAQGDAYFIDFEGEPIKPLDERRAKSSPWRDVAGMVRSFAYAAEMAARQGPEALSEEIVARRQTLIDRFLPASREAFLEGYGETALLDHRWRHADGPYALLALFTLEKAAYELCYEAANRPDWLAVPLRGLAAIVEQLVPLPLSVPREEEKKGGDGQ